MEYDIKAKPTTYNGRNYRSRLEAQWAAFFDLTGWEFQYEPSEINGYNPDFIIKVKSKMYDTKFIIVEVKPAVFITEEYKSETLRKYKDIKAHILILSDMPFTESDSFYYLVRLGCGWQYLTDHESDGHKHYDCDFEMKCHNDFGSMLMSFDGMVYDKVERKQFLDWSQEEHFKDIITIQQNWAEAGNMVQFKVK